MQNRNLRSLSQRTASSAAPSFVVPSVICVFSSFFLVLSVAVMFLLSFFIRTLFYLLCEDVFIL